MSKVSIRRIPATHDPAGSPVSDTQCRDITEHNGACANHGALANVDAVLNAGVKINVNHTYALKDAAQAHRDLEARKTTGSIVLLP